MGLKEKSKENAVLAYELHEQRRYNAAVNRFYYSVFQKLHNTAISKWQYTYEVDEGSSHTALIKFISSNIDCVSSDASLRMNAMKAKQVTGSFRELKKIRIQADYSEQSIAQEDMDYFLSHYQKFNKAYGFLTNL